MCVRWCMHARTSRCPRDSDTMDCREPAGVRERSAARVYDLRTPASTTSPVVGMHTWTVDGPGCTVADPMPQLQGKR